jgi:protein-S-isoprenylcysteine O-methyltransferase Ste14
LFIGLFGEGVIHWPTIFSVGLFPVIVIAYVLLAKREEKKVIEEFGEEYLQYKRNVPAFLPAKDNWKQFIQRSGNAPDKPD